MCFFIGYFCLLIIKTIAIIKANAMIVTDIKPVSSNLIINSKAFSTIRLTSSYIGGKPHLLISFPMNSIIPKYGNKSQCKIDKKTNKIKLHKQLTKV